jgi:PAS domain S-box-containing protein
MSMSSSQPNPRLSSFSMRWTPEREYLAGAAVVVFFLLISGVLEYRALRGLVTSSEWVTHTGQIIQELEGLESTLVAEESAARGHAITGGVSTLASYYSAVEQSQAHIDRLRKLTVDNPNQQHRLNRLFPPGRQALLEDPLQAGASRPSADIVQEGEKQMTAYRQGLREMADEEYALLQQRNEAAASSRRRTERAIAVGIVFAVLVVIGGTFLLLNDLAKRNKAEAELRSSEQRFHALAESAQEGIISADDRGRIVFWNPAAGQIFGYSTGEVLGRSLEMLIPERFRVQPRRNLASYLSNRKSQLLGRTVEMVGLKKDGSEFPIEVSLTTWQAAGAVFFAGVVRDITERKRAEASLRESEERFRLLVREVRDYAILMLGPEGNILSWNLGAERIAGYRSDEIVGRHVSVFYPVEDVGAGKPESGLRIAATEGRFADEGWRVRKDGSRFWASVVITALRDDRGNLKGFSKVTRDVTERKKAEEALRDLSGRLLRAEDQERRRLAREFHDGTSQVLASMQLQLALMQDLVPQDHVLQESLSELTDLVDRCGTEIRTVSHLLHPPILDEAGLESAIRSYAEGFGRRSGITVTTDIPEGLPRFSSDIETALFRITQEALANIHRHSGSNTAYIRAVPDPGRIRLEIRDQGCGIPAEILHSPAKLGVGIRGMTERVRLLGGELVIESDERGTTVRAELPSETPASVPT